ncbi:MAG: hypothetical protein NVS4B3_27790 [Gemmatimonadaceae bacterium]
MLIDEFLPHFDVVERHERRIAASSATVYAAIFATDFGASEALRVLLGLRALPHAFCAGRRSWRALRKAGPPCRSP